MRIGKKAILFDRDGVLNIDSGYVYRYENIRWIDGAREAVARLTEEGWLLFVVTNQSGVALLTIIFSKIQEPQYRVYECCL